MLLLQWEISTSYVCDTHSDVLSPFRLSYRDTGMAFLDQTGGGGYRLHWRTGVHVRAMQGLHPVVEETQGLQQSNICAEPPRDL